MAKVREYKSDVFSMLMQEKVYALQVYNALNGTRYTDENIIQIRTLENGVSLSVRNDAAFVVNCEMTITEHQSTFNPNMPLRSLYYYSSSIFTEIKGKDLYGRNRVLIPTPHFIVFYNGIEPRPEIEVLRLSDSFQKKTDQPELELICTVYNINPEMNVKMMNACPVLKEYTLFVEKVRELEKKEKDLETAVLKAIDYCINNHILQEFLKERKEEVLHVMTLDYTWERREEIIRKEEREAGRSEGRREGRIEGRREGVNEILLVYNWLKENGRMADAQSIMERGNEEVREKLFREYEAMRKE